MEGYSQRRNQANCVLKRTADNRSILNKEVMMKSNNATKEMPMNSTTNGSTGNVSLSHMDQNNNAIEDRELINRMNAFTQITGLLTDDPFYEVL